MNINYEFVPAYKSAEKKFKSDVISYAGMLLELIGSETVIVSLDEDKRPVVYQTNGKFVNALDLEMETY